MKARLVEDLKLTLSREEIEKLVLRGSVRHELRDRVCPVGRIDDWLLPRLLYTFILRGRHQLVLVPDEVGLRSRLRVVWHLKGAHLLVKHLNLN